MRHVYSTDEIAHLWAHKAQDDARNPGGNFYFTGPTLYSYGSHYVVAHHCDAMGVVLVNDNRHSNTTSKHQYLMRRALTHQQRETALHFPSLNADTVRSIDSALRDKRLPDEAVKLVREVQTLIASLIGKRHGSNPWRCIIADARRYDATARALYGKRKYPMPVIPENDAIPATRESLAAFIRLFASGVVREDYKRACDEARKYLAECTNASIDGHEYTDPQTRARIVGGTYDCAERGLRACDAANGHSRTLRGKPSRIAAGIRRQLQPLAAAFKATRDNAERAITLARIEQFARRYALRRHIGDNPVQALWNLPGHVNKVHAEAKDIGVTGWIAHTVARAYRASQCDKARKYASGARQSFEAAESYGEQWPRDALRCYLEVTDRARWIEQTAPVRYAAHLMRDLQPVVDTASARIEALNARMAEIDAKLITAWISGTSNIRPKGTFARIVGDRVETTRGAVVPLEHARRLARVYERIVQHGGQSWADGAGPMVGHYRVNSIGADGALRIGCHEFNPAEAKRLRDIVGVEA